MKRVAVMMAACGLAACGGAFERIAQADHWDFSGHFDVETEDGIRAIIDHIQLTGANTLAWRVNGGSSPRYWSREENALDMAPAFNPVRIPDGRAVQGRIRLFGGGAGVDAYKFALEELGRRKLGRCAYWPYEENHHFTSKVGAWNLDHPQFWCVNRDGKPWMGRASIAFPEVRAHKLRLLDEILAYGPDSIYIEAWRTGGWTVADEYVKPNLDAWRAKYPGEEIPKPDDPRWIALVAETQHAFFRDVRKRLDASGRKVRFLFGVFGVSKTEDPLWSKKAIDWRRLVREDVVDGIVIASVKADPKRPLESTKELYELVAKDKGRCQLFCPVSAYTFQKSGIANYAEWLGVSKAEATRKLLELAHEVKADGILMECVDFRNYTPEMCDALR